MNILITLPKHLIEHIIKGDKKFEMRRSIPKNLIIGQDGFFAVEKGTCNVRCWCRVDSIDEANIDDNSASLFVSRLCVDESFIRKYAKD